MRSRLTILKGLRHLNAYLAPHLPSHHSLRFEELVCQAFAALLHLPYFDAPTDDSSHAHRVTWLGNAATFSTRLQAGRTG